MTMLAIPKNAEFEFNGLTGHVKFIDTSCALLDFDEKGVKMYEPHQLQDAYIEGEFKILQTKSANMLNTITDQAMSHRYRYYNAILTYMHDSPFPKSYRVVEEAIAHADSIVGPVDGKTTSVSKAKRLYTKWSNNGYSITYLIKKSKERRRSQFTRDCESLADAVIQAEYLQLQGASVHETYKIFLAEYEKERPDLERQNAKDNSSTNELIVLKPMGRTSFYSYIDRLDPYEVDKARIGVKAARKRHRCVKGSIIVKRPLERVEVDAVHLNIALEVKMEDGTIEYERPIVYIAIDVFTRLIVGYVIDYSDGKPGETANAVVELIKQICNPFKKGKHTGIAFPLGGKPDSIVCDSGRAFTAATIQMMLQSEGIKPHITQKASPWKKPFVERFFGTLKSQCMSKIPGYAGIRIRGIELDNTLEEMAQFSRDQFETLLERYMLGIYHNNPHKGLDNLSPIEMWEEVKGGAAPQILCDFTDISKFRGQQLVRTICIPKGFQINGVHYNCPELQALGHKLERRNKSRSDARQVNVLYSLTDISEITVINTVGDEMLCVPAITLGVTFGMSLESFRDTKKGRKNRRSPDSSNSPAETMRRVKVKKRPKVPNTNAKNNATDIKQAMSDDAKEQILSNGIGKHADNHSKKRVTKGTLPSAIPAPVKPSALQPSSRR